MSIKLGLTMFALLAFATGCAPVVLLSEFDALETKKFLVDGNNTLKGNAFLRQRGGGIVTCAGYTVELIPVTAFSEEVMARAYLNKDTNRTYKGFYARVGFANLPNDFYKLVKTTTCDAQGNFKFENVADGNFFVQTTVVWNVPNQILTEGGNLLQKVSLKDGQIKEVVLTN